MGGHKILITGSNGFLGQTLRNLLSKNGCFIIATGKGSDVISGHDHQYINLDVTSINDCNDILNTYQPTVIINTAAFTDVNACEKNNSECRSVNTDSIFHYTQYVNKFKPHFIQISTDFVFDGKDGDYDETDKCSPVNYYGFSKLEAEKIIISNFSRYTIIRTSLLYGLSNSSANFVSRIKQQLIEQQNLNIVDDQYRTPTFVNDVAKSILTVIQEEKYGIYHISSGQTLSIFDIVCNIAKHYRFDDGLITRISSSNLNQIAKRPMNTTLNINKSIIELNFIPTELNNALNQLL